MARRLVDTGAQINLTPLLDIIFNLLFFFLLATNIRQKEQFMDVTLPAASSGETRTMEERIPEIVLKKDSAILLDGEEVTAEELEARLVRARSAEKVREVLVSSDSEIAVQRFFDVADICRSAGIVQVTPRVRPRTEQAP